MREIVCRASPVLCLDSQLCTVPVQLTLLGCCDDIDESGFNQLTKLPVPCVKVTLVIRVSYSQLPVTCRLKGACAATSSPVS